MNLTDTSTVTLLSLAVAYAMVVLGVDKRALGWRRRTCPACGLDVRSCRCRRPNAKEDHHGRRR